MLVLFLITSTLVVSGVDSLSVRQTSCSISSIPTACVQAVQNYTQVIWDLVSSASASSLSQTASQIESRLDTSLTTICGTTCLPQILNLYECMNNTESRNITLQVLCARNGIDGTLCLVKAVQTRPNGGSLIPTCTSSTTCSNECHDTYNQLKTSLGCCAKSLYGNPLSPLSAYGSNFTTCGAMFDESCYSNPNGTNPTSGASLLTSQVTVIYVNMILILVTSLFLLIL